MKTYTERQFKRKAVRIFEGANPAAVASGYSIEWVHYCDDVETRPSRVNRPERYQTGIMRVSSPGHRSRHMTANWWPATQQFTVN
jgi:hypothetical protein